MCGVHTPSQPQIVRCAQTRLKRRSPAYGRKKVSARVPPASSGGEKSVCPGPRELGRQADASAAELISRNVTELTCSATRLVFTAW